MEVLASLKFDKQLIQQYLREDLMQEAPMYQEIIQRGVKSGKLELVIRLLKRRVGDISPKLEFQVQELPMEKLDTLSEALLDFSQPSDFVNWMDNQS